MTTTSWPPEFTLRKSPKAKRATLRISIYGKIEVVVPAKTRFFDPLALINEHQSWIYKQLAKSLPKPEPITLDLPQEISFPGLQSFYKIEYEPKEGPTLSLRQKGSTLKISGDLKDKLKIKNKLILWLNKEAGKLLLPHLVYLADLHQFSPQILRVRFMKTRWGSCSSKGKITLNSHLAFMPLNLIHHVILHELCHTRYMSHGPRFWGLLNRVDPLTPLHDKALSQGHQHIPSWWVV
jgi:predicted metal-dependent hydrolase